MDIDLIKTLSGDFGEVKVSIDEPGKVEHLESPTERIPGLTEEKYKKIRSYVQDSLSQKLKPEQTSRSRDPAVRSQLRSIVMRALVEKDLPLGDSVAKIMVEELGNDLLGYGPIEPFFYDPEVTEITARWDNIRIEKHGVERVAEGVRFRDQDHIKDVLERMLAPTGRKIDMACPKVNARLHDGSRMIAHIPPVAVEGPMFSIRRFRKDMTVENLLKRKVLNEKVLEFLRLAVVNKQNLIISGGTSSGKTTILNCLASYISEDESIVTIEDPAELQLQHTNVRRLEAKPPTENSPEITLRELVADALRMAPKRIILGECRKGETFDMLQAMNTGHLGSMTTAHANSAWLLGNRLINMVQMAKMDLPRDSIVEQIASAVDFFIHITKERGGRRRLDHICEVQGTKRNEEGLLLVALNLLWQYNPKKDDFEYAAKHFKRSEIFIEGDWSI